MLKAPHGIIRKQLATSLTLISLQDFPEHWPNLVPDMVANAQSSDFNVINGVLRVAHAVFGRYRNQSQSNQVLRELKYVLNLWQQPLTTIFMRSSQLIETNQ